MLIINVEREYDILPAPFKWVETSDCRAVLRRMVLLCPRRVSAGKGTPDIWILFSFERLQGLSKQIPPKPPYIWIGSIELTVRSSSTYPGLPNFNRRFDPPFDQYSNLKPNTENTETLYEFREAWFLHQIEIELCIPLAAWINDLSLEEQ